MTDAASEASNLRTALERLSAVVEQQRQMIDDLNSKNEALQRRNEKLHKKIITAHQSPRVGPTSAPSMRSLPGAPLRGDSLPPRPLPQRSTSPRAQSQTQPETTYYPRSASPQPPQQHKRGVIGIGAPTLPPMSGPSVVPTPSPPPPFVQSSQPPAHSQPSQPQSQSRQQQSSGQQPSRQQPQQQPQQPNPSDIPPPPPMPSIPKQPSAGISTGVSQSDAKANLAAILGRNAQRKAAAATTDGVESGPTSTSSAKASLGALLAARAVEADEKNELKEDEERLSKYNKMKKMGLPMDSIINKMKLDGVEKSLIAKFKGEKVIDIKNSKFDKYRRMRKMGMPQVAIVNKMKLDGIPAEEIDAFFGRNQSESTMSVDVDEEARRHGLRVKRRIEYTMRGMKMKRLHWRKVPIEKIKETIWKNIDEDDVKLDVRTFEMNFQFRAPKPKHLLAPKKEKKASAVRVIIRFVPAKRDQSVQIGLRRIGKTDDEIREAIITMNENAIDIETHLTLMECVPTEEEQQQADFEGSKDEVDPDDFGRTEHFFLLLSDIVDLELRMRLWLFKRQYKEVIQDRMEQVRFVKEACDAMTHSPAFAQMLKIVLAMGNYMNANTSKGKAYGYELHAFSLMNNIKDFSNSTTMMMYLFKFCHSNYRDALRIFVELESVKIASRIESSLLERSIQTLTDELELIPSTSRRWQMEHGNQFEAHDSFFAVMKVFYDDVQYEVYDLKTRLESISSYAVRTCEYFHFKLDKGMGFEMLFKTVQSFLDDLMKARDELIKLEKARDKAREKKRKEREKAKRAAARGERAMPSPSPRGPGMLRNLGSSTTSILDEIRGNDRVHETRVRRVSQAITKNLMERRQLAKGGLVQSMEDNDIKRRISRNYHKSIGQSATEEGGLLPMSEIRKIVEDEEE